MQRLDKCLLWCQSPRDKLSPAACAEELDHSRVILTWTQIGNRWAGSEWWVEPPRIMLQKLPDDEESRELDCVFLPVDLDMIALGISRQPDNIKQ